MKNTVTLAMKHHMRMHKSSLSNPHGTFSEQENVFKNLLLFVAIANSAFWRLNVSTNMLIEISDCFMTAL